MNFLGRVTNTLPAEFTTLAFASLRIFVQKYCKVELWSLYEFDIFLTFLFLNVTITKTIITRFVVFCNDYNLSKTEKWMFPIISPCVKRHWSQASKETSSWNALGHRFVALIEVIPVVGTMVSLIELLAVKLLRPSSSQSSKIPPSLEKRVNKLADGEMIQTQLRKNPILAHSSQVGPQPVETTQPQQEQVPPSTTTLQEEIVPSPIQSNIATEDRVETEPSSDDTIQLLEPVSKEKILSDLDKAFPSCSEFNESERVALALYFASLPKKAGTAPLYAEKTIAHEQDDIQHLLDGFGRLILAMKAGKIQVETPEEEMIEIFNLYHVIQLRPLKEKLLVIGCGHLKDGVKEHRWEEGGGGKTHAHKDADTVNVAMGMNPSVVARWGVKENNDYFKGKNYKEIRDEGPIVYFMHHQGKLDDFFQTCQLALDPNGELFLPNHIHKYDQEVMPEISLYASKHGFTLLNEAIPECAQCRMPCNKYGRHLDPRL